MKVCPRRLPSCWRRSGSILTSRSFCSPPRPPPPFRSRSLCPSPFSQCSVIWIGNIPEESSWYLLRAFGGWQPIGIALFFGHFILPFFFLLSRELKRNRRALAWVAAWILVFHYLDLYWVVMPVLHAAGPRPHWRSIAAFLGIAGF